MTKHHFVGYRTRNLRKPVQLLLIQEKHSNNGNNNNNNNNNVNPDHALKTPEEDS
jgi:hypothetical protein